MLEHTLVIITPTSMTQELTLLDRLCFRLLKNTVPTSLYRVSVIPRYLLVFLEARCNEGLHAKSRFEKFY